MNPGLIQWIWQDEVVREMWLTAWLQWLRVRFVQD